MRITKNQLRQIIKEELAGVLREEDRIPRQWPSSEEGVSHYERDPITLGRQAVFEPFDPIEVTGVGPGSNKYAGISDPNNIEVGQAIFMPDGSEHIVKPGDNLGTLAKTYNTDIDTIMAGNRMEDIEIDTAPRTLAKESKRRRKVRKTRRK